MRRTLPSSTNPFRQPEETSISNFPNILLFELIDVLRSLTSTIANTSKSSDETEIKYQKLKIEFESLQKRHNELEIEVQKLRSELEVLRSEVSKLNPPLVIGGSKLNERIFNFVPGLNPLSEGIITYLTKQCDGNVSDRQRVHIFADSIYSDSYLPRNMADFVSDAWFESTNNANQSVGYDFKDNQSIVPTHYTIRTSKNYGINSHHLKSWIIEGSNDRSRGELWVELDRRENCQDLNASGVIQTFQISKPLNREFRYIRIRQFGANFAGHHFLVVCAFELFGQLRIKESVPR
jgi:hypothetical protein